MTEQASPTIKAYQTAIEEARAELGETGKIAINFRLTFGLGLISALVGILMIGAYLVWVGLPHDPDPKRPEEASKAEQTRNLLDFVLKTIGTSAGITSALYVGENLKNQTNTRIKERELKLAELQAEEQAKIKEREAKSIEKALDYIRRWNDPSFSFLKSSMSHLRKLTDGKPEEEHPKLVAKEIENNKLLEQKVKDLLNFLEEVGYAYNKNLADQQTIKDYFVYIFYSYNRFFADYIHTRRQKSDDLYIEFTNALASFAYKPNPL